MSDYEALRAAAEAATPGPWRWSGSVRYPQLTTVHGGRVYVMGFERSGMRGAQPTFQVYSDADYDGVGPKPSGRDGSGVMHPASELAVREVPYRDDIVDIANQDARWIAAADPTTVKALIERCRRMESALRERSGGPCHACGGHGWIESPWDDGPGRMSGRPKCLCCDGTGKER